MCSNTMKINHKIKEVILIFLTTGMIGWIILSIFSKKFTGFLYEKYGIPFKPTFAFGAIFIYLIYPYIKKYDIIVRIIIYAIILTFAEFLFSKIFKIFYGYQLWTYYNGMSIAPLYTLYWICLAIIFEYVFIKKDPTNKINIFFIIISILIMIIFYNGHDEYLIERLG